MMSRRDRVSHLHFHSLKLFSALLLALLAFFGTPEARAQKLQTLQVPMADGKTLTTTIVLPSIGNGPWPVLLSRTPYQYKPNTALAIFGIAVVEQHTRGRYKSEGDDTMFGDDRQDGTTTVDWIRKQSWCNGVVSTFGASALGITQLLMADSAASISGQLIIVGTPDLYQHGAFWGGAFRQALMVNWSTAQAKSNNMPVPHPMLAQFEKNAFSNTPLWEQRRVKNWAKISTPGLHIGGWYDIFNQGTIDAFVGYRTKGDPKYRNQQYLIMGPWVHSIGKRKSGGLTYPPNAETFAGFVNLQLIQAWLSKHLLKQNSAVLNQLAPVNIYLMGDPGNPASIANRWLKTNSWPVPSKATRVYLRSDKKLTLDEPAQDEASETFAYDPKNPVPTAGGGNLTIAAGAVNQKPLESRKDVIVYNSDVLADAVPVIGRIKAHLWVSTDAKDTDFTVKLTDVYPDGRSMLVLDGIVRLRHRASTTKEEFVTPGTPVQITVDLWSTAILFEKGHRIRIAISSSNSPRFQPNPNTGAPFSINPKNTIIANNTIYHDKNRASYLEFPVVDLKALLNPSKEPPPEKVSEPVQEPTQDTKDAGNADTTTKDTLTPDTENPKESTPHDQSVQDQTTTSDKTTHDKGPKSDPSGNDQPAPKAGCGCEMSSGVPFEAWLLTLLFIGFLSLRRSRRSTTQY